MSQQIVGKLPEVIWSNYGSNFRSRLLRVLAITISSLWLWSKKQTITYILYGLIVYYENHEFQDIEQNRVGLTYTGAYLFNLFKIPNFIVKRFMFNTKAIDTFSNYKYDSKTKSYTLELVRFQNNIIFTVYLKHKLHSKDVIKDFEVPGTISS